MATSSCLKSNTKSCPIPLEQPTPRAGDKHFQEVDQDQQTGKRKQQLDSLGNDGSIDDRQPNESWGQFCEHVENEAKKAESDSPSVRSQYPTSRRKTARGNTTSYSLLSEFDGCDYPAAGKGTRMAPVTKGGAKELLRLGTKTVLERIVDEAIEAGAGRVIVVSSPSKSELTSAALRAGCEVKIQSEPRGLADAVAICEVEDEVLILFGDCVYAPDSPSARMADLVSRGIDGTIAVETVSDDDTRLYGIVEVDERTGGIGRILEKPAPDETTSRFAVAARMAFGPRFMAELPLILSLMPIDIGEIPLTPVLQTAISKGHDFKAVMVQPDQVRIDCGDPQSYRDSVWLDWD